MRIIRYGLVAGLAAAADMTTLYLFTPVLGLPYLVGTAAGFLTGLTINYLLSIRWVFQGFRSKEIKYTHEFAAYALIGVAGLALSLLLMRIFVGAVHLPVMQAKVLTTGFVFFWNYLGRMALYKKGGLGWRR